MKGTRPMLSLRRLWKNKLRYLVGIILTSILFFGLQFLSQYFSIKHIEFRSLNPTANIKGAEQFYDKLLFTVSPSDVNKKIVERNPFVKRARAEKKYPDRLIIHLDIQPSHAALQVNEGYFILGLDGRILEKKKQVSPHLPDILYYQKLIYQTYNVGETIALKDILTALHFLDTVQNLGIKAKHIDINGFNMIRLVVENNREILFTTDKEISVQDYQVETLIRQFKIEGKEFQKLDIRFDKPIITIK